MTETVLTLLLKSVVLTIAALVFNAGLRRYAARSVSAASRHLVCATAATGLLILPLLSHIATKVPIPFPTLTPRTVPVIEPHFRTVPAPTTPFETEATKPSSASPLTRPFFHADDVLPSEREKVIGRITSVHKIDSLATLYAVITFALLVRLVAGHVRVWQIVRRAKRIVCSEMPEVAVRESGDIAMPLTVGTRRGAVIVLPAGFAATVATEQLRAVLLHETAHIRRDDYLLQIIADIACVVYFANPFVWLLAVRQRDEAERAADDAALAAGLRPSEYAGYLLATVRGLTKEHRGKVPSRAVAMAQRSEIGARIEALVCVKVARNKKWSSIIVGLFAVVPRMVAGLTPAYSQGAQTAVSVSPAVAKPGVFQQTLEDGSTVEVVAIRRLSALYPLNASPWWKPDGSPFLQTTGDLGIADIDADLKHRLHDPSNNTTYYEVVTRTHPFNNDASTDYHSDWNHGANAESPLLTESGDEPHHPGEKTVAISERLTIAMPKNSKRVTLSCDIATQNNWKNVFEIRPPLIGKNGLVTGKTPDGTTFHFAFSGWRRYRGNNFTLDSGQHNISKGTWFNAVQSGLPSKWQMQFIATSRNNTLTKQNEMVTVSSSTSTGTQAVYGFYGIKPSEIRLIQFRIRPQKHLTFSGIALTPNPPPHH